MKTRKALIAAITMIGTSMPLATGVAATGNPDRGRRVFGVCVACHSLEADKNMTGPSLASLWNRRAGSLPSFTRYSPALKSSDIVWNDRFLDSWIENPQHLVSGNEMTFPGIKDAQQRADLLAFLKDATQSGEAPAQTQRNDGQMVGMMGGSAVPNLKNVDPESRVRAITRCRDTYKVATADGKSRQFWERNLRFKTDVSESGPKRDTPAIVRAGMLGDRADVIFSTPEEISRFVSDAC